MMHVTNISVRTSTTLYDQHQATAAGKTWQKEMLGPGRRRRSILSTPR